VVKIDTKTHNRTLYKGYTYCF